MYITHVELTISKQSLFRLIFSILLNGSSQIAYLYDLEHIYTKRGKQIEKENVITRGLCPWLTQQLTKSG